MTSARTTTTLALAAACALAWSGCAGDDDGQRVLQQYEDAGGDDADGGPLDAGPDDADETDADTGPEETGPEDTGGDDADNGGDDICQPDGDYVVRADQFYTEGAGGSIPYEFTVDTTIDIWNDADDDGIHHWDLTDVDGDDFVEELELRDPDDYWFGDEFPDADYATRLSVREDELGVYRVTDDALLLVGLATEHGPDSDEDHTNITYDPPIDALRFPLEEGKTWETEVEADGEYAEYASYTGHEESYDVEVDAVGEIVTPYGSFDVVRVYTVREHPTLRWGWFGPYMTDIESRIISFVAECFGTVARVMSHEDEDDEQFDEAAEVMRLTQ